SGPAIGRASCIFLVRTGGGRTRTGGRQCSDSSRLVSRPAFGSLQRSQGLRHSHATAPMRPRNRKGKIGLRKNTKPLCKDRGFGWRLFSAVQESSRLFQLGFLVVNVLACNRIKFLDQHFFRCVALVLCSGVEV